MAGKRSSYKTQDFGSEFEYDSEVEKKKVRRYDLADKPVPSSSKRPPRSDFLEEHSRDEARRMRHHHVSSNAYARHKELVNNYLQYYGGKLSDFKDLSQTLKRDSDIIRENHQFVWEESDNIDTWDKQLSKRYYDKLFKEYCLVDLSKYKENKIAMRWRTEKEVVVGKGQFICGNKACGSEEGLRSWEVNFGYVEKAVKKNALVKLRLCPTCSDKLNYHQRKNESTQGSSQKNSRGETSAEANRSMDDVIADLLL